MPFKMFKLVIRIAAFVGILLSFVCVIGGLVLYGAYRSGAITIPALPDIPDPQTIAPPDVEEFLPDSGTFGSLEDLTEMDPTDTVVLSREVQRRPIVARLPASPKDISTEPDVIGTNIFLAIIMALVFGVTSTVLENILEEEEPRIEAWIGAFGLKKLVNWSRNAFNLSGNSSAGVTALPIIVIVLIGYGAIFALLEVESPLASTAGLVLAVQMTIAVAIVTFASDLAQRMLARIWGNQSKYTLYPANLLTAIITVIASRLFALTPGIVFGAPGGSDIDIPPALQEKRETTLSVVSVILVAAVGVLGFVVSSIIGTVFETPIQVQLALTIGSVLKVLQDISLLVFLIALESVFFDMLPTVNTDGKTIMSWNPIVWAILFLPTAFVFTHFLLNPGSEFLNSFQEANVRFLVFAIMILIWATAALWFYFKFVDDVLQEWVGLKPRPGRRTR